MRQTSYQQPHESAKVSPFQQYADAEGFRLDYVARSYSLLCSINANMPNFYELAEIQAKKLPRMSEKLYKALRAGMDRTPEEFAEVDPMFWTAL